MLSRSTAFTIAATCVCAFGIGFFMQKTAEARSGAVEIPPPASVKEQSVQEQEQLTLRDIAYTSVDLAAAGKTLKNPAALQARCAARMTARALPDALVELQLVSPCRPGARFSLHHGGVNFTEQLDRDGAKRMLVPALSQRAVFLADFPSGEDVMAIATLPHWPDIDRVILQAPSAALALHVLELGATYGEPGHIWSQNRSGRGAFLALGDSQLPEAQLVQVYSLKRGTATTSGEMAISVEVEVTSRTCGAHFEGLLLDQRAGRMRSRDLALEMPGCEALGGFLVLNNLVENLKIARN